MKRIISTVFIVTLISFLFVTLIMDGQKEKSKAAQMTELQEEARPYEQELAKIRLELENKKEEINVRAETGIMMIGFVPASGDDISTIKELLAPYSYTPLIILDCSLEQEILMDIILRAAEQRYEMIPAGISFDEQVLESAEQIRNLLPQYGYEGEPSFFIRKAFDTVENRNMLEAKGYHSFVRYSESLDSGITDSGSPFITHGFLREQNAVSGVIEQVISAASYTVIAIDYSDINNGTISLSDVADLLTIADEKISSGEIRYANLSETFQSVITDSRRAASLQAEYEQYEKEQQKRIEELEDMISEIYSHWNQNEG